MSNVILSGILLVCSYSWSHWSLLFWKYDICIVKWSTSVMNEKSSFLSQTVICIFLFFNTILSSKLLMVLLQSIKFYDVRAVFKWPSKVITRLRLLLLVIGLKDSRQFFIQWESKLIAPCTRDFSRALSELEIIARNCDWLIVLFAPVVIGRKNCFGWFFDSHLKTALLVRNRESW